MKSVIPEGKGTNLSRFNFDSRDLSVLEAISKGEYMTFGIQGKQIRQHLPKITPSAMTRIFKRLKVHGLIEKIPGSIKIDNTAWKRDHSCWFIDKKPYPCSGAYILIFLMPKFCHFA